MAEPNSPNDPTPEESKTEESKPMVTPADSRQDGKVAASKTDAAKLAKKPARQKKEQPAPAAGTAESLSLATDDVDKPKIVKAKAARTFIQASLMSFRPLTTQL